MSNQFLIGRDSSEKEGHGWNFSKLDRCLGTEIYKLKTGDYTIKGLEDKFTIERKRSTSEFAINLFEDRFKRELDRMDKMIYPFLVLEFPFEYILTYPKNSGIPKYLWNSIKIRGNEFLRFYHELCLNHPKIHIAFVGNSGKQYALSLFKRISDIYNIGFPAKELI